MTETLTIQPEQTELDQPVPTEHNTEQEKELNIAVQNPKKLLEVDQQPGVSETVVSAAVIATTDETPFKPNNEACRVPELNKNSQSTFNDDQEISRQQTAKFGSHRSADNTEQINAVEESKITETQQNVTIPKIQIEKVGLEQNNYETKPTIQIGKLVSQFALGRKSELHHQLFAKLAQSVLYGHENAEQIIEQAQMVYHKTSHPQLLELISCLKQQDRDVTPSVKWLKQFVYVDEPVKKFVDQSSFKGLLRSLLSQEQNESRFMATFLAEFVRRGFLEVPSGIPLSTEHADQLNKLGIKINTNNVVRPTTEPHVYNDSSQYSQLFNNFQLEICPLCIQNQIEMPEQICLEFVFFNQIKKTESLVMDRTRLQGDVAPLLTIQQKIQTLTFNVENIHQLVKHILDGKKMFVRMIGQESGLVYDQGETPCKSLLSTCKEASYFEIIFPSTNIKLILSMSQTWTHEVEVVHNHFHSINYSKHKMNKETVINPFEARNIEVTPTIIQNEMLRKRARINAAMHKNAVKTPLSQLNLGEDYLLQQWKQRNILAKQVEMEKLVIERMVSGNCIELVKKVIFGIPFQFYLEIINHQDQPVKFLIQVTNAKILPTTIYVKDPSTQEAYQVALQGNQHHIVQLEFLCVDPTKTEDVASLTAKDISAGKSMSLAQAYKISFKIEKPPIVKYMQIKSSEVDLTGVACKLGDVIHKVNSDQEYEIYSVVDYEAVESPFTYIRDSQAGTPRKEHSNLSLYVSSGEGKADKISENEWSLISSQPCRAHLVDSATGQILKRYLVTHVNTFTKQVAHVAAVEPPLSNDINQVEIKYAPNYSYRITNTEETSITFDVNSARDNLVRILTSQIIVEAGSDGEIQMEFVQPTNSQMKSAQVLVYINERQESGSTFYGLSNVLRLVINY